MAKRLTVSYYPWIKQRVDPPELAKRVGEFCRVLQGALDGLKVELLPVMEIPDQLEELKKKPAGDVVGKIGLLNPIGYAMAHAEAPEVDAIAVIRRKIGNEPPGPTYKAQLYTHRDHAYDKIKPIKTVKDMRGRSIAFGSPQSTSNFLVPAMMLWEQGIHPLAGLTRTGFAGGHDTAAEAVYKKTFDIGAGHDGAILVLATKKGFEDATKVLVRIAWSELIPSDPVAIHTADPNVKKQVLKALLKIAPDDKPDSEGNQAIKGFWDTTEGFEAISADNQIKPESYAPLLRIMYPLGLRPNDMLRKL